MKENQFTVDLGKLKLTDVERKKINAAIQKAAANELATINSAANNRVVLVPVTKRFGWPILWGLIIRDINETIFKDIIKNQPIA